MSKLYVPSGYKSRLSLADTQQAIAQVKTIFQYEIGAALNLKRVSAPLFVESGSGLNDDLNGVERPVEFDVLETGGLVQIVQSLAKWKRMALYQYDFPLGVGLYTDMNAIRRDEEMDNIHSIYVDQWDWEKVISREQRTLDYLKATAKKIVETIGETKASINNLFPQLEETIDPELVFVTTQELEDMYPALTPKQREDAFVKEHKSTFIMQIGDKLKSGERHDGRAPDYDDWALNGDIVFWHDQLNQAFEISSMGIRVDSRSLDDQLTKAGADDRRAKEYHRLLLEDKLPLTIGGGIGQSRLCMLLLEKAHIGEIQVSVWDDETKAGCATAGIELL